MEVLKKLNFKNHNKIILLNPPEEFKGTKEEMSNIASVKEFISEGEAIAFVLAFVKDCEQIAQYADLILPKAVEGAVVVCTS